MRQGEFQWLRRRCLLLAAAMMVQWCAGVMVPMSDDVLGLMAFKAGLHDPTEALRSWREDDASPCAWAGIVCDRVTGRVSELNLVGFSLIGQIGRGLIKLDELQTLNLSFNNLTGSIDAEVARLPMLRKLNVSNNQLNGVITPLFMNNNSLVLLDLSNNAMTGPMAEDFFTSCQSLVSLYLVGNSLNGSIPASVGSCFQLTDLSLAHNLLSGEIPGELGQLPNLVDIDLSHNMLTGTIPAELGALKSLTSLSLMDNKLTGSIPAQLSNCGGMLAMDVSQNSLSGTLPPELQSLTSLALLNGRNNMLTGDFPPWLGHLNRLQVLDFATNRFTGAVPTSLGQLQVLQVLDLSGNLLLGTIPVDIGSCMRLQSLDLSNNNLTGSIPPELLALNVQFLNVAGNGFTGNFPAVGPGDCPFLQFLDVSENNLEGPLLPQIGQCSNLVAVNFSGNGFSSFIPAELGNLASLTLLDLSNNAMNLAQNLLNGPMPGTLTNLTSLAFLDLSSNNLTGDIPPGFENMKSLQKVNISFNHLTGPIPNSGAFSNPSEVSGNPGLCGNLIGVACPPGTPKPIVLNPNSTSLVHVKREIVLSISAIIAISAAAVIAVGVILVTVLNIRAQTRAQRNARRGIESVPQSPSNEHLSLGRLVLYKLPQKANNQDWLAGSAQALLNKHDEIGRGGFGTVYRAILPDGNIVAVKKLLVSSLVKTQEEFEREVNLLGKISHQNLVTLQGYYWTSQLQLLVYDYVPNGNLYRRLHERRDGEPPLRWEDRFKIALGTALGLGHLHHGCHPQVIHYNLKSTNILLSHNNVVRISDYGLAKLLPALDSYVMSSKFQSALGYMAPEFACPSLRITEKCDVYGFGVLLLELVTGRRPVEYMEDDVVILCDHVRALLEEGRPLSCVDSHMNSYPEDEVLPVIKLGLICTSHVPSNRPSMEEVVQILELIRPILNARGT
ncbi:uncharacterized protein [Physcomitrium patens]|uniref:uncharacterized protein isoform X2 n=1 Tax=Physcomitrium patens TaxID=3218 RepID=UPI000D154970|nr:probable LRR receptor-like serine/threonine-protein kinase IRK isoform X2 [Physcomitrium patens]|eukprot:XP_024390515.1 probable LRR receptor-like serine/threonine-protein kinase IRK isoform X2 [Physcomitrella patens]